LYGEHPDAHYLYIEKAEDFFDKLQTVSKNGPYDRIELYIHGFAGNIVLFGKELNAKKLLNFEWAALKFLFLKLIKSPENSGLFNLEGLQLFNSHSCKGSFHRFSRYVG